MEKLIIGYCRVSTKKQVHGIDGQKEIISQYVKRENGQLIEIYEEKESGKNADRTQLKAAVNHAKEVQGILVISKLDRLSREITFLFDLKKELDNAGVKLVCVELPELNTLTLGIFATMAQHERELISKRTKEGLAIARAKGKKIGSPKNLTNEGRKNAAKTIQTKAKNNENNKRASVFAEALRGQGKSLKHIAKTLNANGFKTARGFVFQAVQVSRLLVATN